MRVCVSFFSRPYDNRDKILIRSDAVAVGMVELDHYSRNERTGAVLRGTHLTHSMGINHDVSDVDTAGRARKIDNNPIGMDCRLN